MDRISAFTKKMNNEGIEYALSLPLSSKSSFRIGGVADVAVFPKNAEELAAIVTDLDMPYIVVGNCSNILFEDEGYRGCVIFTENMNCVSVDDNRITAGAGASSSGIKSPRWLSSSSPMGVSRETGS